MAGVCEVMGLFMYISLINPVPFIWKEFSGTFFVPSRQSRYPGSLNRDPG